MTSFGCMRLKGRLDKGSDSVIRTEITKTSEAKKPPALNKENILQGRKEIKTALRI